MKKLQHTGKREAVKTALGKTRARRSASVMKPEYLAEIARAILKKRVSEFKNSEEGRRTMCEAIERIAERREARGKRETMLATAKRMLESGMLALKDIAKFSGLSLAQVKKLQASMA